MEARTLAGSIFAKAVTGGVLLKTFSETFYINYRKTPVLESIFNKVAALRVSNFIKKRL